MAASAFAKCMARLPHLAAIGDNALDLVNRYFEETKMVKIPSCNYIIKL